MKNWITNNFLPLLLIAMGFIANDTELVTAFLREINAPMWLFTIVKYVGLFWAAFKLYNSKSAKIKAEIKEALASDPKA